MGKRGSLGRECFSSPLCGSLVLPLWDPFFMVCPIGLWELLLVIKECRKPYSEPRIPEGQISAGSRAGTRLGRASVSCSWEHGQGETSQSGPWTLNHRRQQQQQGPCARKDVASPSLRPPPRALIYSSEMAPALCSLRLFWFSVCSPLLPTWVELSEGRAHAQFSLMSFPDTFSTVSRASVNVMND